MGSHQIDFPEVSQNEEGGSQMKSPQSLIKDDLAEESFTFITSACPLAGMSQMNT